MLHDVWFAIDLTLQLSKTIQRKHWNGPRNMYVDTEAKDTYSQHANSLAILSGISTADQVPKIANKMLTEVVFDLIEERGAIQKEMPGHSAALNNSGETGHILKASPVVQKQTK